MPRGQGRCRVRLAFRPRPGDRDDPISHAGFPVGPYLCQQAVHVVLNVVVVPGHGPDDVASADHANELLVTHHRQALPCRPVEQGRHLGDVGVL